jgi:LysM repeat protein
MAVPVVVSIEPNNAKVGDPDFVMTVRGSNFTPDMVVDFGGQQVPVTFIDQGFATATISKDNFPKLSLGGVSVGVSNFLGDSNNLSFDVSENSPITLQDVVNVANGISFNSVDIPTIANNPFVKAIQNVDTYLVKTGDTLQSISVSTTGSADSWMDIALLNNLRYPYISDDVEEIAGQLNTSLYLTRIAHAGDSVVYVNGINQLVQTGTVLFFILNNPLSNGSLNSLSDIVNIDGVVRDIIPGQSRVLLNTALTNTYDAGTKIDVLNTQNNTTSRIISPGQFILVPSTSLNASVVKSISLDLNDIYSMLGQDFRLDQDGQLQPDSNGDVQTLIGIDNLGQAMWHRLITEQKELVYHPKYGNPLIDYIGSINTGALAVLATQQIKETLLADPRIDSIQTIKTTVIGDTLNMNVVVNINTLNISSQFNFVISNTG